MKNINLGVNSDNREPYNSLIFLKRGDSAVLHVENDSLSSAVFACVVEDMNNSVMACGKPLASLD